MTKLEMGLIALVFAILGAIGLYAYGHHKGAEAVKADVVVAQAKTVAKHAKVVSHVQAHVDALPPAPATSAADSVGGTANGELQNDWRRD